MLFIILFIVVLLCLAGILIISLYFYKRFSLSKDLTFDSLNKIKNPLLTIGIIGDSWATFNKIDDILHHYLLENGYKNKILSSGQSGAKTKLIYENLFKGPKCKFSSKFIIENTPEYCILLAGTNDANGQMGGNYYSYHLIKIIKVLLKNNIKPVVLTLPKVGIKASQNGLNIFKKYRNVFSARFNNSGVIENIEMYRNALEIQMKKEKLKNKIILINFDDACEGFEDGSELYKNPLHLSNKGNKKLGYFIAKELVKELKNNNTPIPFNSEK